MNHALTYVVLYHSTVTVNPHNVANELNLVNPYSTIYTLI